MSEQENPPGVAVDTERKAAAPVSRHEIADVIVVGAGFSGLYALHRLREMGLRVRVIEAAGDVGGTWYWNRYPGARCDAVSALYSYSFSPELEQDWSWREKYATQPEILDYIRHVADRFDMRRDIWFNTRVTGARYDDAANQWNVRTDRGDQVTAPYCIMASGCLSVGRTPSIPGLGESVLRVYHTGAWPHEGVDFTGQRVGVIGTGSSGVQLIPEIAKQAAALVVYQRTPNFVVPARNATIGPGTEIETKKVYRELRAGWRIGQLLGAGEDLRPGNVFVRPISALSVSEAERQQEYERRWVAGGAFFVGAFNDLMTDSRANQTAVDFVRGKIRNIVEDPATAQALTPTDHPIGSKRICVGTDYFETFNRPNVSLVDLRSDPIVRIERDTLLTERGRQKLDALIFATGFDAMTGALLAMDIRGGDGLPLAERWAAGPRTYLGLAVSGFPNLFLVTGPGSPSVLGNVVSHIEQHVDFIVALIEDSRRRSVNRLEVEPSAEEKWVARVNQHADATLFPKANSWYMGANIPGKPRIFMPFVGGIGLYREICDQVASSGYAGFQRN